ncbi:MAG: hypothetical protein KJO49_01300 [Bacteroidia bacterium]|nr:hypothetical protein [Bacteroidia bacterium]
MIKFFRLIRQRLLSENKFSKYLLYAIGEIVLVVIGILIALSINNKNEQHKLNKKEQGLLKELNLDFRYNRMQLDSLIYYNKFAKQGGDRLLKKILLIESNNQDINTLDQEVRDSLKQYFIESSYTWTFNPKNGTINSIINSSALDIIKNDSLRRAIISWNDVLGDYLEDERAHAQVLNSFFDWSRFNFNFIEDEFHSDNVDIFFSKEHKNFLKEFDWTIRDLLVSVESEGVIDLVDAIITLTEKEIME